MPNLPTVTIINVGYRSANIWVVSAGRSRLLLDLGWPGTMGALRANLARMGVPLSEICYGLATHYHMDHAGLAQDLKLAGRAAARAGAAGQRDHTNEALHEAAGSLYGDYPARQSGHLAWREPAPCSRVSASPAKSCALPAIRMTAYPCCSDDGAAFTGDLPPLSPAVKEYMPVAAGELATASGARRGARVSGSWADLPAARACGVNRISKGD